MSEPEYEYRVVCTDDDPEVWGGGEVFTDIGDALKHATWCDIHHPTDEGPHTLQRRPLAEWEDIPDDS